VFEDIPIAASPRVIRSKHLYVTPGRDPPTALPRVAEEPTTATGNTKFPTLSGDRPLGPPKRLCDSLQRRPGVVHRLHLGDLVLRPDWRSLHRHYHSLHICLPHGHTQTAQCAAKRSEQRPLPILRFLRQYQPHQRPAYGFRRLPLVTLERQLIPVVLLPRPGLTPYGRRVLAGPHNRVPLRTGSKRVSHGPFYDLLQRHASSPPGS